MNDRRSSRLVDYDYTRAGIYHITLNTSKREKYFGEVKNKTMVLYELGQKANEFIQEIPIHYPFVMIHNHEVMPDHIHILIEIKDNGSTGFQNESDIGSTDRIGSKDTTDRIRSKDTTDRIGSKDTTDRIGSKDTTDRIGSRDTTCHVPTSNSKDSPAVSPTLRTFGPLKKNSISSIIGQYKAAVTRWCNSNGHRYFAWQGRFYDQIISDQSEFEIVNKYISDNPANWEEEKRLPEI